MKFFVVVLCFFGYCSAMSPEYIKKIISENQLKVFSVLKSSLQNVSKSCVDALNSTTPTDAFKYLDNTGRAASGLMDGNGQWLGNYGACLKMESAHYCYSKINAVVENNYFPISWGLCVPKDCSESDVAYGLESVVDELYVLASKYMNETKPFIIVTPVGVNRYVGCTTESKYSTGAIVTLIIIGIFLFLSAVGTTWDLFASLLFVEHSSNNSFSNGELGVKHSDNGFTPHSSPSAVYDNDHDTVLLHPDISPSVQISHPVKDGILSKILLSFSMIKNTDQIMNTKVAPNSITCINGIRVISMFWVILGHTFLFFLMSGTADNLMDAYKIVQTFCFLAVDNAFVSVDSFFFLSGLLVGYLGWRRMEKNNGKLPLFGFYFHRFWRLTPALMFVILLYDKMIGFFGEGPVWFNMQSSTTVAPCDKYWWTNLLYINNFYPKSLGEECVGWSWYLANDMQFYVISPIILYVVYKWKWIGAAISIGSLCGISIIITIALMAYYDLSALMFSPAAAMHPEKGTQYSDYVYSKPYCRITPYLVGMLLGYFLHNEINIFNRINSRMFSWIINSIGWIVAAALGIAIIYGPYSEYKVGGKEFSTTENVLYGGFFRFIWGILLAWVVYTCHNGYGGQVNRFLSASYWIPLSRLTYAAYLLHPFVILAFFYSFETASHFTLELVVFYFIAIVALTYGAAYVLAIFIELPLTNLEKLVFKM